MASKIDSSEGSFMAELEGMESKRLEAATDYAGKLEDRYVVSTVYVQYDVFAFCQMYFSVLFTVALSNLICSPCHSVSSYSPLNKLVHYQFNTLHQPAKTLAWVKAATIFFCMKR